MLTVKEFLAQLDKVKTWAEWNCEPDDAVQVRLIDDAHPRHSVKDLLEYLPSMEAFVDEAADPDRVVHISVTTKDGKRLRGRLCNVARRTHGGVLNLVFRITEDKEAEK